MRGTPGGEMSPRTLLLMLLMLGVSAVYGDSHSLRYYHTGVSSPGSGLPVFSAVGYVDDQEIVNYNSDTRQYLPKVEWMKKLGDDYWERNLKGNQAQENVFKRNVQIAMSRLNHTGGLHIVQVMYGCELRDDGSTAGYYQHGYDGRDFTYLDTKSWLHIPSMTEAQLTTQRWNSPEERQGEIYKNYLQDICIPWLRKYINNGREDLERRVRPEVKVWGHQSDEVTTLHCLAYGFHPRPVDVKWVRNGEHDLIALEANTILPHPDGTYQIRVSVEVPTKEGDSYSCHLDHSSLEEVLAVIWEPPPKSSWIWICIAVVGLVCVAGLVVAAVIWRKLPPQSLELPRRRWIRHGCCHLEKYYLQALQRTATA